MEQRLPHNPEIWALKVKIDGPFRKEHIISKRLLVARSSSGETSKHSTELVRSILCKIVRFVKPNILACHYHTEVITTFVIIIERHGVSPHK
jgi:hypothetical protein